MSTEERNKAAFMQMYTDVFNQGKLSLADELFAADFIDHEVPPGVLNADQNLCANWLQCSVTPFLIYRSVSRN